MDQDFGQKSLKFGLDAVKAEEEGDQLHDTLEEEEDIKAELEVKITEILKLKYQILDFHLKFNEH